jgi:RNA polymerase-binding transcription factor DksA
MTSPREISRLRERLLERRGEIVDLRRNLDDSWRELREPEVEFEETAEKEKISQGLEQLDEREKDEIEAIDRALRKMEAGSYGICESCGQTISMRRLEALPWTNVCNRCARGKEGQAYEAPRGGRAMEPRELPPEYRALSDEELVGSIYDTLRTDGRVDPEELEISCREGVIYLDGILPSETKHQILLGILKDTLGFPEIVDRLRIERLPWEQRDRAPRPRDPKKTEEEVLLQGEDMSKDPYDSRKTGTPMTPPDRLIPEKEE